jgi:hypothetical protein
MGFMKIYWVCIEAVQWSAGHGPFAGGHVFSPLASSRFAVRATDRAAVPLPGDTPLQAEIAAFSRGYYQPLKNFRAFRQA